MSSVSLLERTLYLVRNRPVTVTYAMIAAETGVSAHWLKMFASGNITDPGVNKIEKLYEYLNGSPLNFGEADDA